MPRGPKPPVSAWIVRERKRLGLKPHDLAARLTAMGLPVADGTPRTWEAGRAPSAENIEGLERIFGTLSPDSTAASGGRDTFPEVAALITRLDRYAELVDILIEENRLLLRAVIEERAARPDRPAPEPDPDDSRLAERVPPTEPSVASPREGRPVEVGR